MKKTVSIILIFLSTLCYAQNDAVKEKIKDLNDLYGRRKFQKVETLSKEILTNQYGTPTNEDKCNVLALYTTLLIWDDYENKNYKLGYDYILDLLDLWKNGMNDFPLKDSNVVKINELIKDLEKKHPELKASVKENENKPVTEIKTETINKTTETTTTETTTPKSTSDDKTVTLTVSGTGKTLEEARLNALRSAIEQAFGAFISAKTEILNDNLVRDEIVSIANGNIEKYDIISQTEIQNIGFAMTLNAKVSIEKLTSFAQSKGVLVEFEGGMFATKIMLQKLNEDSEFIAVKNLLIQTFRGLENSVEFSLNVNDPKLDNYKTEQNNNKEVYNIKLEVIEKPNSNYYNVWEYFKKSIDKICLSESQASEIQKTGRAICKLFVDDKEYLLRNEKSINAIFNFSMLSLMLAPNTFIIKNNIETVKINSDRGKFFRAFISYYENDIKNMNVSLITAPEQVDIEKLGSNEYGSLLDYVKINGLNLNSLFSNYKFVAEEYGRVSKNKNNNNIRISTTFDYCRGISDFREKSNLTYNLYFSLDDLKKINSFNLEKVPFEEILKNYKSYRNKIDRETFSCFLIGTKISTPSGKINIENIKVGDKVICFDDKGELHTSIVESINKHDNQDVYKYYVWNGEALNATTNHWVLTSENSFSEIGKLNEMLTLVDINGGLKPITKVEYIGKETVYNFIVKDYHTYIANDIRVHNGGKGKSHLKISEKENK